METLKNLNNLKNIFDSEEVNTSRQASVDIAKVVVIVVMVFIHTLEIGEGNLDSGLGYFFDSIAGAQFGAPVFMFCMGLALPYSRNSDPVLFIKRGISIFLLGWELNVLRALPYIILVLTGKRDYMENVITELINLDILQFAGISFILIGLLKKNLVSDFKIMVLSIVMEIFGNVIRTVDTGNIALNVFLGMFIGTTGHYITSAFPLLNWFFFVAFGCVFGKLLRRCTNIDKFYLLILPIVVYKVILHLVIDMPAQIGIYKFENENLFYHMGFLDAYTCLYSALLLLAVSHFVAKILPEAVNALCRQISTNLNDIYIVSWLIIHYILGFLLQGLMGLSFNMTGLYIICIIFTILSVTLAEAKNRLKKKMKKKKQNGGVS